MLATAIKKPSRIPKYLFWRSGLESKFNKNVRKRVPFSHESVVSDCSPEVSYLPAFSSRLYKEARLLQQAIGNYKADKSLEIGCGYGRLTPWIMEYSMEHHAVEPEKSLFNDAKRQNPKALFYNIKVQRLPFPESFFDLCVSWTVIQHMPPKEQIKAIEEIKRVIKKTAVLIVAEETGTYEGDTVWARPMENWVELFKPWELVWQTDRILEETARNPQGKVMRFELR
jgi:SAM-dependent methyltransferase